MFSEMTVSHQQFTYIIMFSSRSFDLKKKTVLWWLAINVIKNIDFGQAL